mmetsp:Transcript_88173/g.175063  ORF Transcript_88173/g.175063 Transcript_88173/m.175063 type:complete len:349 (+) Transcript_88173:59-1105(+)
MLATLAVPPVPPVPEHAWAPEVAAAPPRRTGLLSASAPRTRRAGAAVATAVAIYGCRTGTNSSRRRQRNPAQLLPLHQQTNHGSRVTMAAGTVSEPLPMEEFSEQDDELSYFFEAEKEDADYVEVLSDFEQEDGGKGETDSTEEDEYWDTGLDYVPEYDEDTLEYVAPKEPERTPGIEAARLKSASTMVVSKAVFGTVLDLGLEIDWKGGDGGGWLPPTIRRPLDLRLSPGCAALHGGALAAEDVWAVHGASADGIVQLRNASPALQQLQAKCLQAGLPSDWQPAELEACLASLVKAVGPAVPEEPPGALLVQVAVVGTGSMSGPSNTGLTSATLVAVARLVDSARLS